MSDPRDWPPPASPTPPWPPPDPSTQAPMRVQAQQPMLPSFPHAQPTPYHLMLRTWTYAWWKPVVGVLIVLFGFFVAAPLVASPVLVVSAAVKGGDVLANITNSVSLKRVGPGTLLYLNVTLGLLILVTWFVMRVVHRMRPRWLTSVMPRMRWKFFFACLGLSVVALATQVLVSSVLPGLGGSGFGGPLNHFTTGSLVAALVVLFTTPLQAAGEEYAFRGYLLAAVGSWTGNKWVAIVVTSLLFAFAHGGQNPPLFFDRFAFGLIAAWLVTWTGGLEAGIALHILNNMLAFAAALLFGNLTATLDVHSAPWWNIAVTVTQAVIYTVLVVLVATKMRLRNKTSPPERAAALPGYDAMVSAPSQP